MPYVVPEVLELRGVSQRIEVHTKDVYEHVLRVVANTPPRPATRWAGLLHDIAKPRTRTVEDGQVHFFGHEEVGAGMAREILRRLKFDRPFIDHVSRLVRLHMRANAYVADWTDGAVRRLILDADRVLPDLLDLSRADITSYRPEHVSRAVARVNDLRRAHPAAARGGGAGPAEEPAGRQRSDGVVRPRTRPVAAPAQGLPPGVGHRRPARSR